MPAIKDSKDPAGAIISTEESLLTTTPVKTDLSPLNTGYYNAVLPCGKNNDKLLAKQVLVL